MNLLTKTEQKDEAYKFLDNILNKSNIICSHLSANKLLRLNEMKRNLAIMDDNVYLIDDSEESQQNKRKNIEKKEHKKEKEIVTTAPKSSQRLVGEIKVDKRVMMCRNESNQRFYFKCIDDSIPIGTVLLRESPCLLVLREDGLEQRCAHCLTKCINTFWPCATCTEVIYCNRICALAHSKVHSPLFCGIVALINQYFGASGLQVYSNLVELGHHKLITIDQQVIEFKLDQCFEQIRRSQPSSDSDNSSSSDSFVSTNENNIPTLRQWYPYAKSELLNRRYVQSSAIVGGGHISKGKELAGAIVLLSLYLYKKNIAPSELLLQTNPNHHHQQLVDLIRILSTDLTVVQFNQYHWNEQIIINNCENNNNNNNINIKKHILAGFNCLFASCVGHSCVPNAEWIFNGQQFVLRSIKIIKPGQCITISFGVKENQSFWERQAKVKQFSIMCACEKCMADSFEHFCLRCNHCGGPVPWHQQYLPNNDQCMLCENIQNNTKQASIVEQGK